MPPTTPPAGGVAVFRYPVPPTGHSSPADAPDMVNAPAPEHALREAIQQRGFAFVEHDAMRALLASYGPLEDWSQFATSWSQLSPDHYLAEVGLQRRRRHAVFAAETGMPIRRVTHQPHVQSRRYNRLQGDIERWFEPIRPEIGGGASLGTILEFVRDLFADLAPGVREWRIEVHQFRIEASSDQPGQPTPEGMHRDGVDYVLVLMIDRDNVASGTTSIHDLHGTDLGSFTLTRSFDAALVDDARVFHGVTAVVPLDPDRPAHRDVLVVTLKAD